MWEIEKIVSKGQYTYSIVRNHPKSSKNGYVLTHRIVIENKLGRILSEDEIVHHIDGNKKNNDISNLQIMKRAEHSFLHNKKYKNGHKVTIVCKNCNVKKLINYKRRREVSKYKNSFCSRKCNGLYNGFKLKNKTA